MENNSQQFSPEKQKLEKINNIFESVLSKNIKQRPYPDDETDKLVAEVQKKLKAAFIQAYQAKNPSILETISEPLRKAEYKSGEFVIHSFYNYIFCLESDLITEIKYQDLPPTVLTAVVNMVRTPQEELKIPQSRDNLNLHIQEIKNSNFNLTQSVQKSLQTAGTLAEGSFIEMWEDNNYCNSNKLDILNLYDPVLMMPDSTNFYRFWNEQIMKLRNKYTFGPIEISYNLDHFEYEAVVSLKIQERYELVGIKYIKINEDCTQEKHILQIKTPNEKLVEFELEINSPNNPDNEDNEFKFIEMYNKTAKQHPYYDTGRKNASIKLINEINNNYNIILTHNSSQIQIPFVLPKITWFSTL